MEELSISQQTHHCPICDSILEPTGPQYSIDQLFDLWKPTLFTPETIESHRAQSEYTQLYSCPNCELDIFLPQIIGAPQFYVEDYNLDNSQNVENVFTYIDDKWEFDEAQKDVKGVQSIIEIGCGNGAFLKKIQTIVPLIIGVEYNEQALKKARALGFTIYGFNEDALIKKQYFDVALSFHVLEHVADPIEFIRHLSTLIKENGKICLSVPNQDGPIKFIEPCVQNMPPHHATRWHKKTFEVLAKRLNLSIEKIDCEPLLLKDHYYYTYYWINSKIIGDSFIKRTLRYFGNKFFGGFFKILIKLHISRFKILKGQSLYVVLKKTNLPPEKHILYEKKS